MKYLLLLLQVLHLLNISSHSCTHIASKDEDDDRPATPPPAYGSPHGIFDPTVPGKISSNESQSTDMKTDKPAYVRNSTGLTLVDFDADKSDFNEIQQSLQQLQQMYTTDDGTQ